MFQLYHTRENVFIRKFSDCKLLTKHSTVHIQFFCTLRNYGKLSRNFPMISYVQQAAYCHIKVEIDHTCLWERLDWKKSHWFAILKDSKSRQDSWKNRNRSKTEGVTTCSVASSLQCCRRINEIIWSWWLWR